MSFLPPAKLSFMEPWIFFGSPMPMLYVFAVYFLFITYGPIWMENRQPYKLKNVIRCYNLYQIVSCVAFALLIYYKWNYNVFKTTWKCHTFEDFVPQPDGMVFVYEVHWYYFLLRMSELLETVFFVLRKKRNQVSFLHIYHHTSTLVFQYILNRYSANVMETHVAVVNNIVHIFMYIYYFLSSFKNLRSTMRKVKPVMTTIQILQLFILFGQCIKAKSCGSSFLSYIFSFNFSLLIIFFLNFYYANYIKKKKEVSKNE